MKYKIAIVEDDQDSADLIKSYILRYCRETNDLKDKIEIIHFSDGDEISLDYKPIYDIIFLDIEMKRLDGMSTAKYIRKLDKEVNIIFITNMSQYAIKGYSVDALNFLIKPVPYFAFSQELKRSLEKIKKRRTGYLLVPTENGIVRLETNDIFYVESMKHKLIIKTKQQDYIIIGTLKEIEKKLSGHSFFRCNNCYLVNLALVAGVQDNYAILDEFKLSISRPKKKSFMEALTSFYGDMVL